MKHVFQNFVPFLANWALKFKKRPKTFYLFDLKRFTSQNLNMGIKTTQDLRWQKSYSKKSMQNWSLSSSILLTCKSFWQITFPGCIFFSFIYFHVFEISVKFFVFWILICKKRKKLFRAHCVHIWVLFGTSGIQIRKKWLNCTVQGR